MQTPCSKADAARVSDALVAGAAYYGVPYPTGVTIRNEDGCHIIYDHNGRIITAFMRRIDAEKVVNRAQTVARKRLA